MKTKNTITNPLLHGMLRTQNVGVTLNGALSNASSLNENLDFFAQGGAMRKRTETDIINVFSKAFFNDKLIALKTLFYLRDVRGGQGEKRTFQLILTWLANNYTDVVVANIGQVAEFGRWDDMFVLFDTKAESAMIEFVMDQLKADIKNCKKDQSITLLAKWMPSINTSSEKTKSLARRFIKILGVSHKSYRKTLSKLRNHIDVVERKMCSKEFNTINFEKVPSKATLLYRKAFHKQDGERYRAYLASVEKGEAKINAGVLYPYDIVRAVESNYGKPDQTLDLQWRNQPDYLKDNPHKGICVVDTSGSMSGLPIQVAVSLGIYFAERNVGPFKDHFITFSDNPKLVRILGNTITEKVNGLSRDGWGMSTNIQGVFDLILSTAVKNKVSQSDMVDVLYIISDMQINAGDVSNNKTNFELIKDKYKKAGYKLPKLVWWNVNATNSDSPVTIDDKGTCLVSGCNPSILKSVLSAKVMSPMDVMLETLNNKRYDVIVVS